jgi:MFS transporter, DHA1 family, multidrug resistance protein
VLGAATLLVLPFVVRVTPVELPGLDRSVDARFRRILGNRRFVRLAASHALAMGALLTFVASAPQLMVNALGLGASAFAALQIVGVAAFAATASQSARVSQRLGPARAIQLAASVQVLACGILAGASLVAPVPWVPVAMFWAVFCAALAIRGPAAFSEALSVPPAQMGRASAILVLAVLLAGAAGTQVVAPFMDGASTTPLASGMLLLCAASLALVAPYPAASSR